MKIATYNINGVSSRLQRLLDWLDREQPDVVCLQELKALDGQLPKAAVREAGYSGIWKGQRSWNGVAILARDHAPVEIRRVLPGDDKDDQSRYLEAAVNGLVIACLYLPNGNPQPGPKFAYKLAWFERLIRHARMLWESGAPVVLAGDYNVVPTDHLDIYDPKSWKRDALLQPESRECWQRLLAQGWTDAIRWKYPNQKVFTFWDYFRNHWPRNAGLRIDHLLLSKTLAPKLVDAGIDTWVRGEQGASDHAPTWIELDLAAKKGTAKKAAARKKSPAAKPAAGKKPAAKKKPPARKSTKKR